MIIVGQFFLFLIESICCDSSFELPHGGSSDKVSQHRLLCRSKKLSLIFTKYSILSSTMGPVVQSFVTLTSSIRGHFKCFMTIIKCTELSC